MELAQLKLPAFRKCAGTCVSVAALALSACAITSDGLEFKPDYAVEHVPVTFDWRSSDDVSGTMTASFEDGRQFSGPYFEITPETQLDRLEPLWEGWNREQSGRHWQPGPGFVKHYSGKVLANLGAAGGERMRCRFSLVRPSSGLGGGGEGRCQFTDGIRVAATLRPTQTEDIAVRR